jgi:hypothetical protein
MMTPHNRRVATTFGLRRASSVRAIRISSSTRSFVSDVPRNATPHFCLSSTKLDVATM